MDVNEATLELLKRQIADDVATTVRARLFATYAFAGSAVLAVLGVVGFGAFTEVKRGVLDQIKTEIEAPAKEAADKAQRALGNVEASHQTLSKLQERSFKTIDNIDTNLNSFRQKSETLHRFAEDVGALDKTLQTIRTEASRAAGENSRAIDNVSAALAILADQVKALSQARQSQSPAPTAGASPANSGVYADINTKTDDVSTKAQQVSSVIQQSQARKTVWFQFAGITREEAQKVTAKLAGSFNVPGEERTPQAASLYEIRCFYSNDCEDADKQLLPALRDAVSAVLRDTREPRVANLDKWPAEKKPRQGTLEVWYGPRGS